MQSLWTSKRDFFFSLSVLIIYGVLGGITCVHFKGSSEGIEGDHIHSQDVARWWGEWSSWSTCSRTCGGGVRSQERHCLQQRLITVQNVNNTLCTGPAKQYELCQKQVCPDNGVSFKQQQCSNFNAKAFGRRYYLWIPLYPDDYINISNKPCDLQCTTANGERQLLVPAHDGTSCKDRIFQGVCIEGKCEVVGCDGILYSSKTADKCGVCGGNGLSCHRISGSYRKGITQLGYLFITNIPAGATDIQIIERRKTENILALSDEAGNFFFNGNSIIDNPRNFHVAGTVFKYRRPSNLLSDGFEYIIALGPTDQGLNVMYYNINGKMPHITYEYTVPTSSVLITVPPAMDVDLYIHVPEPDFEKTVKDLNMKNRVEKPDSIPGSSHTTVDLSYNDNEIDSVEDYGSENSTSPLAFVSNLASEQETDGLIWELQPPLNLSTDPSLLILKQMNMFFHNRVYNKLADKSGQTGDASMPGMTNASLGDQHETRLSFKHLFLGILSKPAGIHRSCNNRSSHDAGCFEKASAEPHPIHQNSSTFLKNNLSLKIFSGSLDSELRTRPEERDPYDLISEMEYSVLNSSTSHNLPLLNLHSFQPVQAPATESNEFEVESIDHDISLADMYRWKVSAYAPCSSTCTTGISSSYAMCIRYDGVEVDETYCDAVTRPEPTQEFCTGKECPPRWETSRWSECSRTCGEGYQFRTVRCWKMMAPGFDSSVYDELCRNAELPRPIERKMCRNKGCGPQWEVSEWSECSARCGGKGVTRREVRCSMEAHLCDQSSKPVGEKDCDGPPCDRRWTVSDWGPCSGICGEGQMTRYVACKNSNGNIISDTQCDPDLKPLAVYPCGDKNCPAHWVKQEWEQCNATCGRGVKRRLVICAGLENGVYKEFPDQSCNSILKPEEEAACFERPCSKWFTTSWSQCSKTCGTGVKVREIKCYQGEEVGHSCDTSTKPESRQSCEIQPCPTEIPDEACQDKASANCALVLKVKLCTHWYYRKACCQSCKNKSP
ncbi:ADAMTS-like protein 2 isoform X1 [Erpetoichthys calabaricus]|uniref:ADAMTS-like protein 2 isoform X1 n=1 Tax=Erpetoichthys calabaricus TaxID=27687 RepID=UPI002233EE66|nr:ADAMTS-like protein 2 isoform X1 [Erpetoichthys calabaricus]